MAQELGISDHLLYRSINEQRHVESLGSTRQTVRAEQEELMRLKRETEILRKERDFYDGGGVLREGIPMRYHAIQEHDRRIPIRLLCRALTISPAGYYAWAGRCMSRSARPTALLSLSVALERTQRPNERNS